MGEKEGLFIRWFSEITLEDISLVGQKAAKLATLYRQKMPVPPGFVITTEAFRYFVQENELLPSMKAVLFNIKAASGAQRIEASRKVHALVLGSPMPKELSEQIDEAYDILHPGTTKSALGVLEKFGEMNVAVRGSPVREGITGTAKLDIRGKDALLTAVKGCFAALFSSSALETWDAGQLEAGIAVFVQPMILVEKEGVVASGASEALQPGISSPEMKRAALYADELAHVLGPAQVSFGYGKGAFSILDVHPASPQVPMSAEPAKVLVKMNAEMPNKASAANDEHDSLMVLHSAVIREALRKRVRYRFSEQPATLLALEEAGPNIEDLEAQVLKVLDSAKLSGE
ncbi:hypothetical protein HYZ97_04980 [Candidatus Pacearchaeota archaeon]|nr:hypothetical protein [Candidatus Pacearchaeota archaeon]